MEYKIKIKTVQQDYRGKSIFDRAASDLMIDETFSLLEDEGVIETSLYGTLTKHKDEYILRYDEDEPDMGKTSTQLKFNPNKPNEISLTRTGELDTFMFFEKHKRHICVYNTGIMPFEVCIYTRDVINRLLDDGSLEINYIVEIKGACAQQTTLKMEIEKL